MKLQKIYNNLWILRSIIHTIYFNFHYLPFSQAIKLPILLRKPKLLKCAGSVSIKGPVKFGMIQLGRFKIPLFPDSGFIFENYGKIIFEGNCFIGNASALSIGESGQLILGTNFCATASLRIVCYSTIRFGNDSLIGWGANFMDTDLHKLQPIGNQPNNNRGGYSPIIIGDGCWIGMNCTVLKGTHLPKHTTVSACSFLNHYIACDEYSVIGSESKIIVKKKGVYRNPENDKINYTTDQ